MDNLVKKLPDIRMTIMINLLIYSVLSVLESCFFSRFAPLSPIFNPLTPAFYSLTLYPRGKNLSSKKKNMIVI